MERLQKEVRDLLRDTPRDGSILYWQTFCARVDQYFGVEGSRFPLSKSGLGSADAFAKYIVALKYGILSAIAEYN